MKILWAKDNKRDLSSTEPTNPVKSSLRWLLLSLLALSSLLNLFLANQVSEMRDKLAHIKSEDQLRVGTAVHQIAARGVGGEPAVIDYDRSLPTILYVFKPSCGWCKRNLENIRAIADNAPGRYKLIGLSLSAEGLKEYIDQNHLAFPVYTNLSLEAIRSHKLGGTPQTIMISPERKVIKVWTGAYYGRLKKEIEEYLRVSLPGFDEAKLLER
jgi:hypothetical protein